MRRMATSTRLLIVDDDASVRAMLREYLEDHGFAVDEAGGGAQMRERLEAALPDAVLLDLRLPGEDGLSLARYLREHYDVGIIMVTASGDVVDRVVGLELGADDYVAKPFSPRELVARLRTILRRAARTPAAAPVAAPLPFQVDEGRRQIRFYGRPLELSRYEYGLLKTFVEHPGHVFTRDVLLDKVWDDHAESLDRTVDAHVKTLRAKLKAVAPELDPIVTHRGTGYALAEDLPASP